MDYADRAPKRDALALFSLIGSTAAALWMVPRNAWRELREPSTRAAGLMVVVAIALLVLRRRGAEGARWERGLLCVFLAGMPLVYLESGLWHGAGGWLALEAVGLLWFAGWGWFAYRHDPWVLSLGLVLHGLAWDSWHHGSHYIAGWYPGVCLVIDLGLAAYVLLQRERLSPAGA